MSSSTSTLAAASSALSSLLARREKQKAISHRTLAFSSAISKRYCSPSQTKRTSKKRKTSTTVLTEEEEIRQKEETAELRRRENVRVLKEFSKQGRKEQEAREELLRLKKEKDLARRGKLKRKEVFEESESESD